MAGWAPVLFNAVDITTLPGVEIYSIEHHKRPSRQNQWTKLARRHGKKLVNSEYAERLIVLSGVISASSRANYEARRDTLFYYLDVQEGILQLPVANSTRNFYCTVDDIDFADQPEGGLAKFILKFIASNPPFGLDVSNTTPVNTVRTGASATETFAPVIGGTVYALPTITVTLNSGTGLTSKYIQIKNPTSGKYIQINRTWVAGDVLVIDCDAKTVKVNGTAVDFTGNFPVWEPSHNQLYREDNFTTRNITVNMVYKKRWL